MNSDLVLKVEHLRKSYGAKLVLEDISFSIAAGEIVGLLGGNGAGKTTAFYITIGLIRQDAGQLTFKGTNITSLPIHQRAHMGMGYLAQEPSVFFDMTVEQNILCILEITEKRHGLFSKSQKNQRLEELLEELHLTKLAKKKASTLSGGERRRLEITRALIGEPSLLLLDEPFANVDPLTIENVKQMMSYLKKKGISILITDHNAREIFSCVDKCCLIQNGTVILEGGVEDMVCSSLARSCYLGENFSL
jgi:lipopolysaccharide export system ATP-binding protein